MHLDRSSQAPRLRPLVDGTELSRKVLHCVTISASMADVGMDKLAADCDEQAYEDKHVHQVYEQIAPHFSSTRYKVRLRRYR